MMTRQAVLYDEKNYELIVSCTDCVIIVSTFMFIHGLEIVNDCITMKRSLCSLHIRNSIVLVIYFLQHRIINRIK